MDNRASWTNDDEVCFIASSAIGTEPPGRVSAASVAREGTQMDSSWTFTYAEPQTIRCVPRWETQESWALRSSLGNDFWAAGSALDLIPSVSSWDSPDVETQDILPDAVYAGPSAVKEALFGKLQPSATTAEIIFNSCLLNSWHVNTRLPCWLTSAVSATAWQRSSSLSLSLSLCPSNSG